MKTQRERQRGSITSGVLMVSGFLLVFIGLIAGIVVFSESPTDFRETTFLLVLGPSLVAIVTGLVLGGFGELIQNTQDILERIDKIRETRQEKAP